MFEMNLENYQNAMKYNLLSEDLCSATEFLNSLKCHNVGTHEAIERMTIYRNNVINSLSEAIADLYPIVKRIIGDDCFRAAATDYVRQCPPSESALVYYGKSFVDFIGRFQACKALLYLADVAELEWCYQLAFHAEDSPVLNPVRLAEIEERYLGEIKFVLQASVTLFSSPWPIDAIWEENLKQEVGIVDLSVSNGVHLLVYRLGLQVKVIALEANVYQFLQQLAKGKSIRQAWESVLEHSRTIQTQASSILTEQDLSGMLGYLLGLSLFSDIHFDKN